MPAPARLTLPANFRLQAMPLRRVQSASAPAQQGLLARLWPTDKPIYRRPAAIGGGALVLVATAVGLLWWVGGKAPEPSPTT